MAFVILPHCTIIMPADFSTKIMKVHYSDLSIYSRAWNYVIFPRIPPRGNTAKCAAQNEFPHRCDEKNIADVMKKTLQHPNMCKYKAGVHYSNIKISTHIWMI